MYYLQFHGEFDEAFDLSVSLTCFTHNPAITLTSCTPENINIIITYFSVFTYKIQRYTSSGDLWIRGISIILYDKPYYDFLIIC